MTYVKAIQSYDTQIENLEIKGDKTLALLVVSFPTILLPIAIVYHAINFNPYVAQLIPLCLELYFIITGYALLLITIYQGILEICRDFLLVKELFIRVTRRYGLLQRNKNPTKETVNEISYLDLSDEEKGKIKNKDNKTKKEIVGKIADKFVENLLKGLYKTDKEVIKALKDIESKFRPVGKKETKLLYADGSPVEKRICIAISNIYKIQEGDTVDWTTVRDRYRDRGTPISGG